MKYVLSYNDLDLYHTLISGQTFEWFYDEKNDLWKGNIYGNILTLKQIGDKKSGILEYDAEKNLDKEIIYYFGLDQNYSDLIEKISFDKYIQKTLDKLYGLRVIRQDPWYCINSFILSSNNTVKNIQNILRNITIKIKGNNKYFPSFEEIKNISEEELRACKAGFRARYLTNFYNKVENEKDFIESLKELSYDEAKEKLMEIKGIGEKVADCILLYAYGKYEAYPIDTHLRKATHECYFFDVEKKPTDKELRIWAKKYWKDQAGFAHFFLFTFRRLYGEII